MARSAETASFSFNHTMLRVKDPEVSLKFYQEVMGMDLIDKFAFPSFTLYFLAFDHSNGGDSAEVKKAGRTAREGILELTHNHGTENQPDFKYANGNSDPGKGFGHIAVSVDDIEAACARFERLGVPFQKRLTDGTMKHIAFIKDPDEYWIEIISSHRKPDEA
ncbi:glyoxalase I [Fomitiporia mediterranea MF3/22]|uniref:glyoxalase I n=1 Tax=Fomitiporia mediterranea (strain MF3/22) TaxID=694068 RepID=UPI0004408BF4|nr:glyoxalase I [Fomitiporia mediterranea MF3/22]EJD02694.1 glyoxalase I [Fomitiporia mediterranea MF3/22]